jgi:hypothetical protein
LPVVRVTYEAFRLIVFYSGGDNEVPKSVVGVVFDLFGSSRRWLCGDRSSRDDQVGDTVRVRPVLTCDLSHSENPSSAVSSARRTHRASSLAR